MADACTPDCLCGYLAWPEWFPRPLQSGYGYEPRNVATRQEMEAGAFYRREFDVDQSVFNCTLLLDEVECAVLEALERDLLEQGIQWFVFPIWSGGKLRRQLARFKGRPKFGSVRGLHTAVTFSLDLGRRNADVPVPPAVPVDELPIWPEGLQELQRDGYSYEPVDRQLAADIDMPGVKRVDFQTLDETKITGRLILRAEQSAVFEAFEEHTLNQGLRWFLLPLWISGEYREYKARFRSRPKATEVFGENTAYALDMEIDKRCLLDAEVLAWLLVMRLEDLLFLSGRLHQILHYQLPGALTLPADLTEGFQ